MDRAILPSGVGYFNLDMYLTFNDFIIDVVAVLNETDMQTAVIKPENFLHLLFFNDGNAEIVFNDEIFDIKPGTFLLYGSSTIHKEIVKQKNLLKYHIFFYIIPQKKKRIEKYLYKYSHESDEIKNLLENCPDFLIVKDSSEKTNELFKKLITELENNDFGHLYNSSAILTEIFIAFFRNQPIHFKRKTFLRETASKNLLSSQICANLEINYKDITLKKLANEFFISERQIQRHINRLHNKTFSRLLNEIRISAAKDFLITSDLSINEIAEEVGYKYTSYFVNIFKDLEGITPLQYRKNYTGED